MQSGEEFPADSQFITEKRLREFGNEIKSNIGKRIDILSQKLDKNNGVGTGVRSLIQSKQGQVNGASGWACARRPDLLPFGL